MNKTDCLTDKILKILNTYYPLDLDKIEISKSFYDGGSRADETAGAHIEFFIGSLRNSIHLDDPSERVIFCQHNVTTFKKIDYNGKFIEGSFHDRDEAIADKIVNEISNTLKPNSVRFINELK